MTLPEFRDLLLSVHADVFHFESTKAAEYTVWREVDTVRLMADGVCAESGVRIAVDHFTKSEYSTIAAQLEQVLTDHDEIFLTDHTVDYEKDTGLIHHAFTCEVV